MWLKKISESLIVFSVTLIFPGFEYYYFYPINILLINKVLKNGMIN